MATSKKPTLPESDLPEKEQERRFERGLRRALSMPPQPKKASGKTAAQGKRRGPGRPRKV